MRGKAFGYSDCDTTVLDIQCDSASVPTSFSFDLHSNKMWVSVKPTCFAAKQNHHEFMVLTIPEFSLCAFLSLYMLVTRKYTFYSIFYVIEFICDDKSQLHPNYRSIPDYKQSCLDLCSIWKTFQNPICVPNFDTLKAMYTFLIVRK